MRSGLFRLAKQSGLYALGNLLLKAIGLALHAFYLDPDLLSGQAYGYLVLMETTAEFGIMFGGMGLATGLLKFRGDERYREVHDALPFTVLVFSLFTGGVTLLLFSMFAHPFATWLLDGTAQARLVQLTAVYIGVKVIGVVPLTLLRSQERVGWYVVAMVAEWVMLVAGVAYLLAIRHGGVEGVLTAWIWAASASTTVLTIGLLRRVRWRLHFRLVGPLFRFGVPLAVGGLAALVLKLGDQYLLQGLRDAETVGIYGWAYKMSGLLNMLVVQSFQMAFTVIGIKRLGADRTDPSLHRRTFRHLLIIGGWGALGLSLFAYDLTLLISDNREFLRAVPLVLPLALGFLGYGLYYIALNVLYMAEKTRAISLNVTLSAGANVLLNLWLIPPYGAWGAAVATLVSYALLAALTYRLAEKVLRAGYAWHALLGVAVLVVTLYAVARLTAGWPTFPRLGARMGLFALYPVLVLMLRIYKWDEIREGIIWLKGRGGRNRTG